MAIGTISAVKQFCSRYWVVILFPTFTVGTIAADLDHTRRWKQPMALFGITRQYVWTALPMTGFMIGWWLDRQETLRMTRFRDKSALFGRELKAGEAPSWP
ncbi:hypothetical protein C0J52_07114 [Blattella germanica]|nr:hypothetical protein C0J52_07114 [Blattella germanica]